MLQLPLDASADEIKMRYRKLSALVHPDKCDDPRAQDAFQEVKRAYEQMQNSERKELCITLIEQATENVKKERKKLVRAVAARVRRATQAVSIGVYGIFTRACFTNAQRKKKGLTEAELETTFEEDVRKAKLRMFATIEHRKKNYVQRSKKFDLRQREKEMEQEQKMRDMLKDEKHWSKGREHRVSVMRYQRSAWAELVCCVALCCVVFFRWAIGGTLLEAPPRNAR